MSSFFVRPLCVILYTITSVFLPSVILYFIDTGKITNRGSFGVENL